MGGVPGAQLTVDSHPSTAAVSAPRLGERRSVLLLGLILLCTLLKGILWSQLVFPLDAPDEPSHFNYVMQVHAYHTLPRVFMTSPSRMSKASTPQDAATRAMLNHYGFTQFRGMPYESTQPPLYYAVAAVLIAPLGEDRLMLMYAVRLVSVLFGVGAVWAVWWGARALWPGVPLVLWGVPLALTLHPQFTFVTSTVTNDAGVVFFGALIFAVWAAGLRAAGDKDRAITLWRWGLLAGVVTSLGLLCKLTMIVMVPGTLLWLWWLACHSAGTWQRLRQFLYGAAAMGAVGLVLVGWWVVRNLLVYGEPTGTRAIFALYHQIYWSRQHFPPDQLFSAFPIGDFIVKSYRSFWAIYGWVAVTVGWWTYVALLLLSLAAVVGLARGWLSRRLPSEGIVAARRRLVWLSAVVSVLALANMLFYVSFVDYQPQARYLFVALGPALALLVLGLRRVTARPAVNTALVWAFLGMLLLMQVLSIPALLDRAAAMAF